MNIAAVDNRRIRRARQRLDRWHYEAGLERLELNQLISWLLDQQAARIARRCGLREFAGVPAKNYPEADLPGWILNGRATPGLMTNTTRMTAALHIHFNMLCSR